VFKALFNGWESFYSFSLLTFYLPLHFSYYMIILPKIITLYRVLLIEKKNKNSKEQNTKSLFHFNKIYKLFILLKLKNTQQQKKIHIIFNYYYFFYFLFFIYIYIF